MSLARRKSIKIKSIGVIASMLFLFGVSFASTYLFTKQSLKLLARSSEQTFPVLENLDHILVKVREYQDTLRSAVAANDQFGLEDSSKIATDILKLFDEVVTFDPALKTETQVIVKEFKAYTAQSEATVSKVLSGEVKFSGEEPHIQDFMQKQEATLKRINAFRSSIHSTYLREIEQTSNASRMVVMIGLGLLCTSLVLGILVILYLQKAIVRPVVTLADASLEVGNGIFRKVPPRLNGDEISHLTTNFNSMVDHLETHDKTMNAIIEHGRIIACSESYAQLASNLAIAMEKYLGRAVPFKLHALASLVTRMNSHKLYVLIDQNGTIHKHDNLLGSTHLMLPVHAGNHSDHLAYVSFDEADRSAFETLKPFLIAIEVNIASALAAIKLGDTMDLVKEQGREIEVILNSIRQGICTIGKDFRIQGSYSPFLKEILGKDDLDSYDLINDFFGQCGLDSEQLSMLSNALSAGFDGEVDLFVLNEHLLPTEVQWRRESTTIICEVDWIALDSEDGSGPVTRVMVVLRDVTQMRAMQKLADENIKQLKMFDSILQIEPTRLRGLVLDCEKVSQTLATLNKGPIQRAKLRDFLRELHLLKGNLRTHALPTMSRHVHEIEESLLRITRNVTEPVEEHLRRGLLAGEEFKKESVVLQDFYYNKLAKLSRSERSETSDEAISGFLFHIDSVSNLPPDRMKQGIKSLRFLLWGLSHYNDVSMKRDVQHVIDQTNGTLGALTKVKLDWNSPAILFGHVAYEQLLNVITQLITNSVTHGYTDEGSGCLTLKLAFGHSQRLSIHYHDDGRGLDLRKLRKNLVGSGRAEENATDEQIAKQVFTSGISTKEHPDEFAGRGLGMGAIQAALKGLEGQVEVRFTEPETSNGFRKFELHISISQEASVLYPHNATSSDAVA